MKIAHRIRMFALLQRADVQNRHARARLNRPHKQSPHMISYPVQDEDDGYRLRTVYTLAVLSMLALIVYLNAHYQRPVGMTANACTQVASK